MRIYTLKRQWKKKRELKKWRPVRIFSVLAGSRLERKKGMRTTNERVRSPYERMTSSRKDEKKSPTERIVSVDYRLCNTSPSCSEDRPDLLVSPVRPTYLPSKGEFMFHIVTLVSFDRIPLCTRINPPFAMATASINRLELILSTLPIKNRFDICCGHLSGILRIDVFFRAFNSYDER